VPRLVTRLLGQPDAPRVGEPDASGLQCDGDAHLAPLPTVLPLPMGMFDNDKQYLESYRRRLREALAYFSNPQKSRREVDTVRAFLRAIGQPYADDELLVGQAEPVDVAFGPARFQVREIVGGRKRMDEFRERLNRALKAKRIRDVMEPWASSDKMSPDELARLVGEALAEKAQRYGELCAELDALVYVNPTGTHLWPAESPSREAMATILDQNWRSVSVVFAPHGIVLFAHTGAPEFLRAKAGQVLGDHRLFS